MKSKWTFYNGTLMKSEDETGAGLLAEKLKLRLYGVARLLCAALIVNAVCLFTLVSFRYLSVPALVALAAIALGLAFPRRPKGRWQRLRESVVCTVAVLHLLLVGLWLHFVVGWFGIGINSRFRAMVEDADRVVIRDGGGLCHSDPDREPSICEITDKAEIAEFNAMFRFSGTICAHISPARASPSRRVRSAARIRFRLAKTDCTMPPAASTSRARSRGLWESAPCDMVDVMRSGALWEQPGRAPAKPL